MGQSRTENILENMLGASNPITEPQSREEALLKQILESGGGGSHTYSDEEHEVGTWVDGSKVYEKTIHHTGGTQGDQTIPHGITGITRILDYEVSVLDNDYSQYKSFFVLPRIDNAGLSIDYITDTDVKIKCSGLYGTRLKDWYVTIRYTKTES